MVSRDYKEIAGELDSLNERHRESHEKIMAHLVVENKEKRARLAKIQQENIELLGLCDQLDKTRKLLRDIKDNLKVRKMAGKAAGAEVQADGDAQEPTPAAKSAV